MNYLIRKNMIVLIPLLMMTIVFSMADAQTPAERFVEEFDALAAYEFGMSRAPLQRISEVVRAAIAGAPDLPYTAQDLESLLLVLIEQDISTEAKSFICRMLGEIGGTDSVEILARQSANKDIFPDVLVALEQNQNDEAAVALAGLLVNADEQGKPAILAAMGRQGNPVSVSALADCLNDSEPAILLAAARALADIAAPVACNALIDKTLGADLETQVLLADACLKCVAALPDTQSDTAAKTLELFRQPNFPTHIRLAAISGLMLRQPDRTQTLLLEALQDENAALAHEALMLARENPDAWVVTALAGILEQAPPERKVALLAILSDFGDASVLPAIMNLTDHEQPEIRISALQAVGVLGTAEQVDFLLAKTISSPAREQRTVREVLARMTDPEVNARLLDIAIRSGDEKQRIQAIAVLADRNAAEAAPSLLALATRAKTEIRQDALRALRTLAPAEMLPELLGLIIPRTLEPIRDLLPQTIAQTALRIPDALTQADAVIAALNEAKDKEVCVVLLEVLGLIGNEAAFEAIKSYPDTTETEVRRAVVTALARFQSPEALGELRAILLTERDETVRAKAFSGYVSALRNASTVALADVIPHLQTAHEQAKSAAERRDFLAAASQLPSLTTLGIIEKMAGEGDVIAEAAQAMVKTSISLIGAYPDVVREKLEGLVAQGTLPEALAGEAKQALDFMNRFDSHVMAWAVTGPYYEANVSADSLFSREFPPEIDADNADWRIMCVLPDANPAFAIELDRVFGGDDRVAFLRTKITAPEAVEAVLEVGTNDGCRIWWNGTLVHALNIGRPLTPGEDKLPVQLTAGENDLMIAVFQQGGAWGATARLVDKDGQPLSGVTCRPAVSE
jgi:HEAT repeat protein